jgi:hypothetical protein
MFAERIHRWDSASATKALVISVILEAIAIAPAVLSPWGHAGPDTTLGWISILLNLPGMVLVGLFQRLLSANESVVLFLAAVFVVQIILLSYLVFVVIRWKKLRRGVVG